MPLVPHARLPTQRRQVSTPAPDRAYIVDLVCYEVKLVVEVDGGQHGTDLVYDAVRTAYLRQAGFEVLRFWNNEALAQTDAVLEVIRQRVIQRLEPSP